MTLPEQLIETVTAPSSPTRPTGALTRHTELDEIGFDSLDRVRLAAALEAAYGIAISDAAIADVHQLGDLAALIEHRGAAAPTALVALDQVPPRVRDSNNCLMRSSTRPPNSAPAPPWDAAAASGAVSCSPTASRSETSARSARTSTSAPAPGSATASKSRRRTGLRGCHPGRGPAVSRRPDHRGQRTPSRHFGRAPPDHRGLDPTTGHRPPRRDRRRRSHPAPGHPDRHLRHDRRRGARRPRPPASRARRGQPAPARRLGLPVRHPPDRHHLQTLRESLRAPTSPLDYKASQRPARIATQGAG
ncbi:acyl carrier protein [Amycolatopsis vastitatis]|uniref:acyl carrier protein n=1 Tax=Amycolatopsis vastitatis TaxID=1905142 RepID=UPI00308441C1